MNYQFQSGSFEIITNQEVQSLGNEIANTGTSNWRQVMGQFICLVAWIDGSVTPHFILKHDCLLQVNLRASEFLE